MNIFVSGLNYKTTPLEIREKFSFNTVEQKQVLKRISMLPDVCECVLLSTCNRTEVYVYSEKKNFDISSVEKALCERKCLNIYEYKKFFYVYRETKAIRHLFKVASGLDSMVLGEDQILGQVKNAYETALQEGVSSHVLNTLFRDTITAAKKVKTYTELSKNSVSIGSLAVKLLVDIFDGKLENKSVLVIGAGKVGSLALTHLCARDIGKIYVTNRSHGKSEDLSKVFASAQAVEYQDRYSVIDQCDIIISSTSSPHYTITKDMLESFITTHKNRVFIDLAVPRDIDEAICEVEGVSYYNIDQLRTVMDENRERRIAEVSKAEQIIDQFVSEYEKWYEFRSSLPIVREVQRYAGEVIDDRVSKTLAKLRDVSDEEKEIIKASITNTVNEIMDTFIYSVRKHGSKEDIQVYFRCLSDAIKEN